MKEAPNIYQFILLNISYLNTEMHLHRSLGHEVVVNLSSWVVEEALRVEVNRDGAELQSQGETGLSCIFSFLFKREISIDFGTGSCGLNLDSSLTSGRL
jgi:hypothetical protein